LPARVSNHTRLLSKPALAPPISDTAHACEATGQHCTSFLGVKC
jgi:hypothetical protein